MEKLVQSPLTSRTVNGYRGYYMDVQRHEISLRVLKNISQDIVSAANEWNIFEHEKRKFVSTSAHVIFYFYYINTSEIPNHFT